MKITFWQMLWFGDNFEMLSFNSRDINRQVSSLFCRTNDPLICPCPVVNVVVSQKCYQGLTLKFYFRPFGDIRSNRKWNFQSAINRKYFSHVTSMVSRIMWACHINLVTCHFRAINTNQLETRGVNFAETWLLRLK